MGLSECRDRRHRGVWTRYVAPHHFADRICLAPAGMNEIARGEGAPSREFHVDALSIKELRSKIGLSQPKFAALLHADVNTPVRRWGRRHALGTVHLSIRLCLTVQPCIRSDFMSR